MTNASRATRYLFSALFVLSVVSLSPAALAAGYDAGYSWVRQDQWQDGGVVGSSQGNPAPDSLGNPVWGYWTTTGDGSDGLNSEAPWYAAERTAMVWDEFQHGSNPVRHRWTREGGSEPAIGRKLISTSRSLEYGGWLHRAMASWQNPVGDGAMIDLTGTARLVWGGAAQTSITYGVEVAIVRFDASEGLYQPLLASVVQRPETMIDKNKWELLIPVEFQGIRMDAGDQLLFTIKNEDSLPTQQNTWVSFYDEMSIDLVSVSAVPEPAVWAALLPGIAVCVGAVSLRSRRLREAVVE